MIYYHQVENERGKNVSVKTSHWLINIGSSRVVHHIHVFKYLLFLPEIRFSKYALKTTEMSFVTSFFISICNSIDIICENVCLWHRICDDILKSLLTNNLPDIGQYCDSSIKNPHLKYLLALREPMFELLSSVANALPEWALVYDKYFLLLYF